MTTERHLQANASTKYTKVPVFERLFNKCLTVLAKEASFIYPFLIITTVTLMRIVCK